MKKFSEQLKSPLFNDSERRIVLSQAVRRSALELVSKIKLPMSQNQAAGKTYRRGRISKPVSAATKALGLKTFTTQGNKERAIVGYKFHRASAPGQVPAVDTGGLIGSIADKPIGDLRSLVFVGKLYGDPLDRGTTRAGKGGSAGPFMVLAPRPFFRTVVDAFRPQFKENVAAALLL
jgi:hypothetical protein